MYKLEELLGLFNLSYNISLEDLKRAKKIVLMTHPDKSRLSPEYFLFYKKAFDIIVRFYEDQNRQNQTIPTDKITYHTMKTSDLNNANSKNVTEIINKMHNNDFQKKFNQLFEENMTSKPDPKRNEWFSKDEPIYNIDEKVNSKNIGQVFEKIKETNSGLVKYRGVENLIINSGSKIHDIDDDSEESDDYVSCDPFSKLKFDDLRKVHKDQTIFNVSEKDFNKVKQYSSVDHFMRERGGQNLTPLEKTESEQLLSQQQQIYQQRMMQKEYASKLRTIEYEQKNKIVLSNFLQLKN
jgi:hypothetical protein